MVYKKIGNMEKFLEKYEKSAKKKMPTAIMTATSSLFNMPRKLTIKTYLVKTSKCDKLVMSV